ncbi:cytochrome P450 [Saccharothrix ecbatanensis]|uniref:Cytochrome P450 n=1 Tax=Saccharothrix ecbatanensis TaxID=1105145 RepID=A0A7W9HK96_9PSEU|nr:cytochrome P450 [Saccharothrix ecbatanensis]MBB5803626.1 cytochrome P450 [Saccharothrix ecbatanensis]
MAAGRTLSRYWMLTNDFAQNPYPVLEYVRREKPVCEVGMPNGGRAWVITRYEDAKAAFNDPRMSRDINVHYELMSRQLGRKITPPPEQANHLANLEPPRHTPLRRAISFAFTPRRAEAMRPRIAELADELLDRIDGRGRADLMAGFAVPLPVMAIAELMGAPASRWPDFIRWSNAQRDFSPLDAADGELERNVHELSEFMTDLIAEKTRTPGDDLMSALIHADPERRLTHTEILSTGFALMSGGNDTTASMLGGALFTLLTHPRERERITGEPDGWTKAMDELIRFTTPTHNALHRVTTEPVEIGGVVIPAGEVVIISFLSANRDERQFPRCPEKFDIDREKPAHLSFGFGIHYCSGAHLAKVITEVGVQRLFERFPDIRLAVDPAKVRYQMNILVRTIVDLPVEWGKD